MTPLLTAGPLPYVHLVSIVSRWVPLGGWVLSSDVYLCGNPVKPSPNGLAYPPKTWHLD